MSRGFYLGAYWKNRPESPEACTQHLVAFLQQLRTYDPIFSRWFQKGRSLAEALKKEVALTEESLLPIVRKGVNRRDFDHQPIPELGFAIYLWAPVSGEDAIRLDVDCGCYGAYTGNNCILDFPTEPAVASRLLQVDRLIELFRLVIASWDPEWGTVVSPALQDAVPVPVRQMWPGWLTYLSSRKGRLTTVSPPARIVPIDGHGQLIVAMDELPSPENPTHVEQLVRVREALRAGKLIKG